MKIGDILSKKEQMIGREENRGVSEADKLKRQREDIEEELERQTKKQEEVIESDDEQYDPLPDPEQNPEFTEFMNKQKPQEKTKYKISVFLDNGQKLPVVFEAFEYEVDSIFKEIDLSIEAKKMIAVGSFRFPGEKVLYIDMLGR